MGSWADFVEKPPVAGSISGAIAGAVATVVVALAGPFLSSCNFERNLAMEAVKGAKSADDVKARLDLLCARQLIEGRNCGDKK